MTLTALLLGTAVVIGAVLALRLHAFLALLAGALTVALLTPMDDVGAAERIAQGFGTTATKIGILIAMAAIVGRCLLESGAAERVVLASRGAFGEGRTSLALVIASFVLSIPVFFDTVFFLMLPIARAIAGRTGRDYLKYVMSIVVGGTLAHSLVPPTPGPLFVAGELGVGLFEMIVAGVGVGSVGVAAGYVYVLWINRRMPVPLRATAEEQGPASGPAGLPPLGVSLLPILLPVLLLGADTLWKAQGWPVAGPLAVVPFLGEKNVALAAAAAAALITLWTRPGVSREDAAKSVQQALHDGAVVILITCAGGAFGKVIQQTGVADQIAAAMPAATGGVWLLVLAFVTTALIRVAQGSATVAMITAIGIVGPLASNLDCHPVYLALAVGCGSKPLPWMNDSGFWVVGRMAGFTEAETLKTFTVLLTIMGVTAFAATVAASRVLPLN